MFKSFPYLLSQYFWILILAFIGCIPFMLPYQNKDTVISINEDCDFNESQIPVVFTHLSDIHIDHKNEDTRFYYNKTLDIITKRIKPDFNIITGDLANNFPGTNILRYGRQQPEDIKMYTAYSKSFKNDFKVFEVDGNHDVFGIFDYETKHNQSEFYKNQSEANYRITVYPYEIHGRNYAFIGLNPYDFPSPHPPLLYNARQPKGLLDDLEDKIKEVKKENEKTEIVVFNHFPYYHWKFGPKTKDGKDFRQILKESNISLLLDGHLHPSEPFYMHHDGFLEIVGCDLLEHQKFSVGVIDNRRFSYHTIDVKTTEKDTVLGFVTNPVPDQLLSNHQIFNQKNTFVRMIVYTDKEPNLSATVSDGVLNSAKLTCDDKHVNENLSFWLCHTKLEIEKEGTFELKITGDVNRSFNFTITSEEKTIKEKIYEPTSSFVVYYQVQLAIAWFFTFIIVFPLVQVPERYRGKFDMWINGQSFESMWVYSIFFGFLAVKSRIDRLPNLIRYSLFCATIWPLCLPTIFITIDHKFGFIWTWGFVCNGTYFDYWGQMFTLMYFAAFILPIVLMFSALAISVPLRWTLFVDAFPTLLAVAADVYILLKWCNEPAGSIGASFSLFSLSFVYFYVLMIVWRVWWKKGLKEANLIPSTALLDNETINTN